jgi:hypothetical protein
MLVLSNEVAKHLIDSIIGMQMLEATVVTSMSKKKIETHSLASKFVTHMLDTKAKGSDEEVERAWKGVLEEQTLPGRNRGQLRQSDNKGRARHEIILTQDFQDSQEGAQMARRVRRTGRARRATDVRW